MKSIDTELVNRIRHDIVVGTHSAGERLSEAQLSDFYGVSRTPIRLAVRLLEREGVIERGEGRGYMVQSPTVKDIKQAVMVRGHLESLAARLMANAPNRKEKMPLLEEAIASLDELIETAELNDTSINKMQKQNALFHHTILENCGNDFVAFTCNKISHLPMLEVGSMAFDKKTIETVNGVERTLFRLKLGNSQHKVIYEAIRTGDSVRAESVMREHSNTMLEYIELFEKRHEDLSLTDLISYSNYQLNSGYNLIDQKK